MSWNAGFNGCSGEVSATLPWAYRPNNRARRGLHHSDTVVAAAAARIFTFTEVVSVASTWHVHAEPLRYGHVAAYTDFRTRQCCA